jgi:hypothetical protein
VNVGLFDSFSEALAPHASKLNDTLAFHSAAIHNKLHAIEVAVSDLGRGDIGNKWQRFSIQKKLESGVEFEIGVCPVNEMWLIQSISSDGVQEKSPPFVILANGILIESIIKEGLGFEGIGGNQVVMPGEKLSIIARETGNVNCVITIIRREYPVQKKLTDMGKDTDRYSPKAMHDPARDEIESRTGQYTEQQAELAGTGDKILVYCNLLFTYTTWYGASSSILYST